MEYIGEHLWIGKAGNVFVIFSFVFALLAAISYFFAAKDNDQSASWKRIARIAFRVHGFSVFGIVAVLFIMLYNHYFEYDYVWHHSSNAMPMRYILSCFWEGQEGSFLLWTFWHVVIGLILQRTAKNFEAPVMATISLVQAFLASMLLGIFVFEHKIGSNPFTVLLREAPDYTDAPIVRFLKFGIKPIDHPEYFKDPLKSFSNYLQLIDGHGLNPLLQNYWMTIHPPTLFLGFALTVVPFAYAIAGLWKKQFNEWIKPALPWTFFGVTVLGIGILMGGAWAYESLSFGGFWAWDPVENASLVPWLTLVGTAHLLLINKQKGQSLITAFFLAILTFVLILYSTFLTRSGILGETSVHAFTDLGMSGQLVIYLFFFLLVGIYLLVINWKHFPKQIEEEGIWSREFWMFVGAVVLLVSSFQIMFYTSMPVWNKLFDMNKAPAKDVKMFYSSWQLPFAFIVTLLIAVGQYFKYKNTDIKIFTKKIAVSFIISLALTILMMYILDYSKLYYFSILLFSSIFAIVANANYMALVLKGKITKAGASVAHIGFAMVLLGALISTSKTDVISQNTSGRSIESLGKDFSNRDNILLTQGDTLPMGNYFVTYTGKRFAGINVYYNVDYFTKNKDGKLNKEFTLSPLIQTNPRMGNVSEPDTRHFATFDVYTNITYSDLRTLKEEMGTPADEYTAAKKYDLKKGDTIFSSNAIIIFDSLSTRFDRAKYKLDEKDIAVEAHFSVLDISKKYTAVPLYVIHENTIQPVPAKLDELGLQFIFWKITPEDGKIQISLQEKKSNVRDFIVMQAKVFPYINILWIGAIVMAMGTILAILERIRRTNH